MANLTLFQELSRPHVDSFNFAMGEGIRRITKDMEPLYLTLGEKEYKFMFTGIDVSKPKTDKHLPLYPSECRRSGDNYTGGLHGHLAVYDENRVVSLSQEYLGQIPIMVGSRVCNLNGMSQKDLIKHHEEERELGGYFISSGKERVIRMLINTRRNYPVAVQRPNFKKKGANFSEHALIYRSVNEAERSRPNYLHWRISKEPVLGVTLRVTFYVPISIALRALTSITEHEIFLELMRGNDENLSLEQTAMVTMFSLTSNNELKSQNHALQYLGKTFKIKLQLGKDVNDIDAGKIFCERYILPNLADMGDKFNMLCFMFRKLHDFATGACCDESTDSLVFQEVLLPGNLYLQYLRNRLEHWLQRLVSIIKLKAAKSVNFHINKDSLTELIHKFSDLVGSGMRKFIATGNLTSNSADVGTTQQTGICISADSVNMLRFTSHFRAVHRGSFFTEMRTTTARKLLPECWGFLCPVHTPDGAPCGLLNHLSANCRIVTATISRHIRQKTEAFIFKTFPVVNSFTPLIFNISKNNSLPLVLDGALLGWIQQSDAESMAAQLRRLKRDSSCKDIMSTMEIAYIPHCAVGSQYAGLYLMTESSRMMRPVNAIDPDTGDTLGIEYVGTFEQPYLDIAVTLNNGYHQGITTHMEISPESLFSFNASLIPFPNYNQSPRNMYQCQMGKQTMAHSSFTYCYRSDVKSYRLLAPESPLVRTKSYIDYEMDHYPMGFNAVVAVISYTGYDMEDAMVLNKASYERGLAAACIYKTYRIDLSANGERRSVNYLFFGCGGTVVEGLDEDGFPAIGTCLHAFSPLYAFIHSETKSVTIKKYEEDQVAYVDTININGSNSSATVTLRIPRKPDIGDKYSSRHGQKGVNSILVSPEDLPWSNSGIVPDLIFNPHGFPTRMTMGMMIEFLAGKAASLTGEKIDCTAFQREENDPPYHDYGRILRDNGFNYWCTERMYSGTTGREIEADIFMGVVYYQRLRHMVADKYQVRSTGRIDNLSRQPIKGRKVGGGIRLGEMERDCLLSHGAVSILHDRLLDCNPDRVIVPVCGKCGSVPHTDFRDETEIDPKITVLCKDRKMKFHTRWYCRLCSQTVKREAFDDEELSSYNADSVQYIGISHVTRYLIHELAGMNIRTRIQVDKLDGTSNN